MEHKYSTQKSEYRRRENIGRGQDTYIEGNVVRKVERVPQMPTPSSTKELSHSTRKNRDRALNMNWGYVLFLTAAIACVAMILLSQIRIQSEITLCVKKIATLESQLNNLRISNDEEYNRAQNSVDLEEVRKIAIGELGMRYAKEGQIINVSGEGSDYVRQLAEIEEE